MTKDKNNQYGVMNLLLISRIVIVLFALVFALVLWKQNSSRLADSVEKLSFKNENVDLLETGISTLYKAENNFRFYTITYDKNYFNAYSSDLNKVVGIIDSLQYTLNSDQYTRVLGASITRKTEISNSVIRLKLITDSLLNVAGHWNNYLPSRVEVPEFDVSRIRSFLKTSTIDSIIPDTAKKEKQSFFKKVKNLFKEENQSEVAKVTIKRSQVTTDSSVSEQSKKAPETALLKDIHSYYSKQIQKFADGRNRLNKQEMELAGVNSRLIKEITDLLSSLKMAEIQRTDKIKEEAKKVHEKSNRAISMLALVSMAIASLFLFLVISLMRKIKRNNQLLESERQKALNSSRQKNQYLSSMSHELRAPLNNITGFLQEYNKAAVADQPKYLEAIGTSANIMLSTVNQILDYSKLKSGKMPMLDRNFRPAEVLEKTVNTLLIKAKHKKLMLNLIIRPKEDIVVHGDDISLQHIVINLVDNAIKYTHQGEVSVDMDIKPEGQGYRMFLQVKDTGIGIPADKLKDVFNEFERLEEDGDRRWETGTGLGLAITKQMVGLQKGRIYIKESSPSGTTFVIEIPYQRKLAKEAPAETNGNSAIPNGRKYNVLLVDDDPFSTLLLKSIFKRNNLTLFTADNGLEAINLCDNKDIHLVLTDINMPVMNGIDMAKRLRADKRFSELPIIATTASALESDMSEILDSGINEVVSKPFLEKDLIDKLRKYLN